MKGRIRIEQYANGETKYFPEIVDGQYFDHVELANFSLQYALRQLKANNKSGVKLKEDLAYYEGMLSEFLASKTIVSTTYKEVP